MSTVEELRSSAKGEDTELPDPAVPDGAGNSCIKCKNQVRPPQYIAGHDILHYVCDACGYEWIE